MTKKTIAQLSVAVILVTVVSAGMFWPYRIIGGGYAFIQTPRMYDYIKEQTEYIDWYQDGGGSTTIFNIDNGAMHMVHDGYPSLYFDTKNATVIHERLVGSTVASLLPEEKRKDLLAIGFGTGISVGTSAELFDHVKVYEIRGSMIDMAQEKFSEFNYDVVNNDNVDIVIQDGIVGVAGDENKYDAALINVPSPGIRGAEKMFARETLELIKSRVKDHGMVFSWIQSGQGPEVVQVLLNNFDQEMGPCRYFFMDNDYLQNICAPHMTREEFDQIEPRELGLIVDYGYDLGYLTKITEFERKADPSPKLKDQFHSLDKPWFDTRALFVGIFEDRMKLYDLMEPKYPEEYCNYLDLTRRLRGKTELCGK